MESSRWNDAMLDRMRELGLDREGDVEHELAGFYRPIAASCDLIRSEHQRMRHTQPAAERTD